MNGRVHFAVPGGPGAIDARRCLELPARDGDELTVFIGVSYLQPEAQGTTG